MPDLFHLVPAWCAGWFISQVITYPISWWGYYWFPKSRVLIEMWTQPAVETLNIYRDCPTYCTAHNHEEMGG